MAMRKCAGVLVVVLLAVSISLMAADTLVLSINGNETYTAEREISIGLAYQGIETPTEMRVTVAGDEAWSEWFDYAESIVAELETGDGFKIVKIETRYWVESKTTTTVYGGWHVVTGERSIILDTTAPMITVTRPQPNTNGWYDSPVTVTYNVFDTLSGVATVPESRTFSTTSIVTLFPKATDNLGNTAKFGSLMIHIDLDSPSVVIADVKPGSSPDVWTAGPVEITTSISDFSGIDSVEFVEGAEIFATDGGGQVFSVLVTDLAGNQASASVNSINIDSALPTTTILLRESEGLVDAGADGLVSDPIDLTAKLDAYGVYVPSNIALAYAFQDSAGMSIEGLNVHATILKVGADSAPDEFVSLLLCDYAPTGGFYYMTLPEALVSGQQYIVWFEASDQAYSFKTRIIGI